MALIASAQTRAFLQAAIDRSIAVYVGLAGLQVPYRPNSTYIYSMYCVG
jgi:hypothetical protein